MKSKMLTFAAFAALLPAIAYAQDTPAPASTEAAPATAGVRSAAESVLRGEQIVPFRCPIEKIRTAYSQLVNPEDTLVALAIEKQTLAICRQSQEALLRIAENERQLEELFEPILAPPEVVSPEPAPDPEPVVQPEPEPEPETVVDEDPLPEIEVEIVEEEPAPTPPPYDLAAVMKDPIGWKAMLVDGKAIFTVRRGDTMDDGSTVAAIARGRVELVDADGNSFELE